jgi:hypothetical protein
MRYERTPFKDIAAVRDSIRFADVPLEIRKTPELSSIEVTFSALEQTLKMQTARRNFSRLVIDSLTALQYFCMKGIDEVVGAQSFLRFLSDLGLTTVLTVESPLEDAETPERLLARGEVRLFRWEHEGRTVRAVGVEKFRGSAHDIRLHPYRITARGIDINLDVTISRDTRRILRTLAPTVAPEADPALASPPIPEAVAGPEAAEALRVEDLEREIDELATAGVDLVAVREALDAGMVAAAESDEGAAFGHFRKAETLVLQMHLALRVARGEAESEAVVRDAAGALRAGEGLVVPPASALFPVLRGLTEYVAARTPAAPRAAPVEPPSAPAPRAPPSPAPVSVAPVTPEPVAAPAVAPAPERPRPAPSGVLSRVASAFGRAPPVAPTLGEPLSAAPEPAPAPAVVPSSPATRETPPAVAVEVPAAVEKPKRRRRGLLGARTRREADMAAISGAAPAPTPAEAASEDEIPPVPRRPVLRRRRAPRVTAAQPGPPPPDGELVPVPAPEAAPPPMPTARAADAAAPAAGVASTDEAADRPGEPVTEPPPAAG